MALSMTWNCVDRPVGIVDQEGLMPETCQLTLQSIDAATKCVPLSNKTLNCARCREEHTFNVLLGLHLVDLSRLLRCVTHHV